MKNIYTFLNVDYIPKQKVAILQNNESAERNQVNNSHWLIKVPRAHFICGGLFPKYQFFVFGIFDPLNSFDFEIFSAEKFSPVTSNLTI